MFRCILRLLAMSILLAFWGIIVPALIMELTHWIQITNGDPNGLWDDPTELGGDEGVKKFFHIFEWGNPDWKPGMDDPSYVRTLSTLWDGTVLEILITPEHETLQSIKLIAFEDPEGYIHAYVATEMGGAEIVSHIPDEPPKVPDNPWMITQEEFETELIQRFGEDNSEITDLKFHAADEASEARDLVDAYLDDDKSEYGDKYAKDVSMDMELDGFEIPPGQTEVEGFNVIDLEHNGQRIKIITLHAENNVHAYIFQDVLENGEMSKRIIEITPHNDETIADFSSSHYSLPDFCTDSFHQAVEDIFSQPSQDTKSSIAEANKLARESHPYWPNVTIEILFPPKRRRLKDHILSQIIQL